MHAGGWFLLFQNVMIVWHYISFGECKVRATENETLSMHALENNLVTE